MKNSLKMLLHYILVFAVKVDRIFRRQRIKVVNKEALNAIKDISGPIIFSPTHCSRFDLQVMAEALLPYRWIVFAGDPESVKGTINGVWLELNGVVFVEREDREQRRQAKQLIIEYAKNGENIVIYPEATWNFSPNLLVLPVFRGIADIALASHATIVPFATEIDDATNTHYAIIGSPMTIDPSQDPLVLAESIRDALSTLRWSLLETLPFCKAEYDKETLTKNWHHYIESRLTEYPIMTFELIWQFARKDKWRIEREQIKADLAKIQPSKQNAFLFDKRLTGLVMSSDLSVVMDT